MPCADQLLAGVFPVYLIFIDSTICGNFSCIAISILAEIANIFCSKYERLKQAIAGISYKINSVGKEQK